MLNACELEIDLFCKGIRVPADVRLDGSRSISRTRAGLGSGLEIVIPTGSRLKDRIWVNVPVEERFARQSPYRLEGSPESGYAVRDERSQTSYTVEIPSEPAWYTRETKRGIPMTRVGVLQGTYLGVYFAETCMYWYNTPSAANCKFCTTGVNVGTNEELAKKVEDVVEVARVAREESGVTFTHFNTGYHYEDDPKKRPMHGLMQARPYVSAIRRNVGGFIGVQAVPVLRDCWDEYDELIELGCDHFSFCVELLDEKWFQEVCPGKASTVGQEAFFEALEYTATKLGRGRVSGEIIAGLEPIEATKRAIDRIVAGGGFPTVCIFRPLAGSNLAHHPSPDPGEMREVMAYQYEAARRAGLAVGILPNIKVSLVVQPEEGRELLAEKSWLDPYEWKVAALRALARPYAAWRKRPRPDAPAFRPEISGPSAVG